MAVDLNAEQSGLPIPSSGDSQPAVKQPAPQDVVTKAEFDGLKGYAKQVQEQNTQLKAQITDLNSKYQGELTSLQTERERLAAEREALTQQLNERESKIRGLESYQMVQSKLMKEHPELLPWQIKGLLRVDGLEGETLDQYLNEFKSTLQATGQLKGLQGALGGTPPPPSPQGAPVANLSDLRQGMDSALRRYGVRSSEYAQAREAYVAAISSKSK